MSSNLETITQKLNETGSEYYCDLRMDPTLRITLSRRLKKDVLSCALSLISNNKEYVISLNRYNVGRLISNITDQGNYFFVASTKNKKLYPVGLLSKVCPEKVQEFKNASSDCIEKAREEDVKEMHLFHEKYYEFQKKREIFNRTFVADSMGMIHNFKIALREFFSFGGYDQKLQLYLENIAERAIAWSVLEYTTKICAEDLLEYSKHHKQINHEEFAKQIDDISGFYGNLSYHAHFGGERMRDYQEEVFDVYSLNSNKLKLQNIERIKKNILSKII